MIKVGFLEMFIRMIMITFTEAEVAVNLNDQATKTFPIQRGVRQGCPIAPPFFIIVREALNTHIQQEEINERIYRIRLPGVSRTQTILQHADYTSISSWANKDEATNLLKILDTFALALRLTINRNKSGA